MRGVHGTCTFARFKGFDTETNLLDLCSRRQIRNEHFGFAFATAEPMLPEEFLKYEFHLMILRVAFATVNPMLPEEFPKHELHLMILFLAKVMVWIRQTRKIIK